jgi:hypothetical protein
MCKYVALMENLVLRRNLSLSRNSPSPSIPPIGKCTLGIDDIMLLKNSSEHFKKLY